MTIDEAKSMLIAKANCIDKQCKGIYEDCNESLCDNCVLCYAQGTNGEQIKLLRQCAEWLEELKMYRESSYGELYDMVYNKAIDDFMKKSEYLLCENLIYQEMEDIAEQLKGGSENDD